ncbi:MAG TPA: prepilin-type N-terminal cleavage/methylation domain-containing protein [Verrucomicrobiae bacterium]|nr:prepilin-type N-terminal cleavage/methylation domain-containing protein [Verrucomicrobiae bacterium]
MIAEVSTLPRNAAGARGFTLIEVLVASGLIAVLSMILCYLGIFGARSFQALGNYCDLDNQSRNALDLISREMRESTGLLAFQTNLPVKSITLTNASRGTFLEIKWDASAHTLFYRATDYASTALLTQCDNWDFSLYSRAPNITSTNIIFYPATNGLGVLDATRCKLINMTWKCSRTILGSKMNTETVQTAQIVLRNKTN